MFLRLRKGLYLLLAVGSVGGAILAFFGLLTSLVVLAAGLSKGEWADAALGLLMVLVCSAGVTGPVWILLAVVLLPNPSPKERRLLTGLLSAAVLAAGVVAIPMLMDVGEGSVGIGTPVVLFVLPMLVGVALLTELWLPVWRSRRRA
ncbi:hypothetical protein DFR24_1208 [Panacagrimonas perspica]|uniref:Uncharacterized protein n=1 Tax=Panacagrimonas perspica TaxID=381431 RepID=A0A4V3F693_9GAMM|nr:hypothetical protein [Panacagrimonas perspica]TDU31826.1 hypothetical protein DFR24_1208 [Panacagrimonas perspica]THD02967.1 hypothetical protein B1810_10200 [Panacagrimonas perspica]